MNMETREKKWPRWFAEVLRRERITEPQLTLTDEILLVLVETSQRLERLTWTLAILTWVLALLTAALVWGTLKR